MPIQKALALVSEIDWNVLQNAASFRTSHSLSKGQVKSTFVAYCLPSVQTDRVFMSHRSRGKILIGGHLHSTFVASR